MDEDNFYMFSIFKEFDYLSLLNAAMGVFRIIFIGMVMIYLCK